jgi:hypothetical protein
MMSAVASRASIILSIYLLLSLTGCTFLAFSDSSAMRVEVEVYKGPLSLEPEIQLGELYGYLTSAQDGLMQTADYIAYVVCRDAAELDNCTQNLSKHPGKLSPDPLEREDHQYLITLRQQTIQLANQLAIPICQLKGTTSLNTCAPHLRTTPLLFKAFESLLATRPEIKEGIRQDLVNMLTRDFNASISMESIPLPSQIEETKGSGQYRQGLMEANRVAAAMQAAAFHHATASTAGQSPQHEVRIAITYFIVAMSEYSNQIQARADALLKQLGTNGRDRRELSLSTHLRESEPTDFLHLFDWMDAHTSPVGDFFGANIWPNTEERIKIVERLYADHFWSKINTVYASGRGKTQMAFVKDESGNWNLKSFANDPTELLEAYTNVAKKALEKAAELAASTSTGGGTTSISIARSLVSFASESEPDKSIVQAPPPGTLSLAHLHTRLAEKLNPAQFTADFEKEGELLKEVGSKRQAAEDVAAKPDSTEPQKQTAKTQLRDAQTELIQHRQKMIDRWGAIINDHSDLVDILGQTVKKK